MQSLMKTIFTCPPTHSQSHHPLFYTLSGCAGSLPSMNFEPVLSQQPARQLWTHAHLVHEHAIALGHKIDRSTKSSYNSATNSYLTFCHLHQCPVDPIPETLSFFHCLHVSSHQSS